MQMSMQLQLFFFTNYLQALNDTHSQMREGKGGPGGGKFGKKKFKIFYHQNAINHENKDPFPPL